MFLQISKYLVTFFLLTGKSIQLKYVFLETTALIVNELQKNTAVINYYGIIFLYN